MSQSRFLPILGIFLALVMSIMLWGLTNVSVTTIQASFQIPIIQAQWFMTAFGVVGTAFVASGGRFADLFGHKRLLLFAQAIYCLACLLAALAPSAGWLIGSCCLFGAASAVVLPATQALLVNIYPAHQRGRAVAIWQAGIGVAVALAPLCAGLLIAQWGWRAIYWFQLIGIALSSLLIFTKTKNQPTKKVVEIDWKGLCSLLIGLASLVLCITQAAQWGLFSLPVIGLAILTILSLALFYAIEQRIREPIIRFSLFANRTFFASGLANLCMVFGWWTIFFFCPIFLYFIHQDHPIVVGSIMIAAAGPVAFIGPLAGRLIEKTGAKILLLIGIALLCLSALWQCFWFPQTAMWEVVVALLLFAFGAGLIQGPAFAQALSVVPKQYTATASGVMTTFQELGGGLGLSIAAAIFHLSRQTAIFKDFAANRISLTSDQVDIVESLISNTEKVRQQLAAMGSHIDHAWLPIFEKAFMSGYHTVMATFLGTALVIWLLVLLLLKSQKRPV